MDELKPRRIHECVFIVPPVEIDSYTYIGEGSHISQLTKIGKFCSIGNLCTIGAQPHRTDYLTNYPLPMLFNETQAEALSTTIGHDVWIGSNSVVLAGLVIGHGAVIGAGSVVTKDVEPYSIVAGNPAKFFRLRFDYATVHKLLEAKWWDWPIEEIRKLPFKDIDLWLERIKKSA